MNNLVVRNRPSLPSFNAARAGTRPRRLPGLALALAATAGASLAGLALPQAGAQTFTFDGTLRSSDNTAPPAPPLVSVNFGPPLGVINFYAWKAVDNGVGAATTQNGWTSLAGVPAASITYDFGDLELLNLNFGAGTATEQYGNSDGTAAFFNLYQNGVKIAEGNDFTLDIVTDTNPGSPTFTQATGTGWVTLSPVGGHPFATELSTLQGGSSLLTLNIDSFVSPVFVANPMFDPFGNYIERHVDYFNDYSITGSGAAAIVPEPSTWASLAASGLVGFAVWRRRRAATR